MRYGITPDLTTMAKIVAGALPGGAVGGKADIVDMIAQRGDPDWDNTERVYHPGTFNGNPLSAVAGATCLEMIAAEPVNQRADAMAARLKAGLNEVFTRMEVNGHAYGVASMIHFTLADGDFDHEFGPDVNRRIKAAAGVRCGHRHQARPAEPRHRHHGPRRLPGVRHPQRSRHRRHAGSLRVHPGRSARGGTGVRQLTLIRQSRG